MSTSTPPGWYPVPDTGPGGAAQERWWDGTAWTAEVRPAQAAPPVAPPNVADAPTQAWQGQAAAGPGYGYPQHQHQQQQPPAPYGYPQHGGQQPQFPVYAYPSAPPPAKNRNALVIGIVAGVVLLAAAAGVAVVASGGDDPGTALPLPTYSIPAPYFSASPRAPRTSPSPRATTPAGGNAATDVVHGWRVPNPAGWTPHSLSSTQAFYETIGPYECGMSSPCIRGQFAVGLKSVPGTDAETVARREMADYAPKSFGDLTDHEELKSGPVTVAGATGFAVRWYVTPETGSKGYVLVVAVPDTKGSGFVLLHGGVDDDPEAPEPAVLDQMVVGIRSVTAGSDT